MDANKVKSNRSPARQPIKKSTLITQIQNDRNMKIALLQQPRKKLSYSTFLDSQQVNIPYTEKPGQTIGNQGVLTHQKSENLTRLQKLQRVRSQKTIVGHNFVGEPQKSVNDVTENTLRLKLEQITLKYKSKISSLLKEIKISANEMIRFNNITKTDEILNFLSLKVRERIVKSQLTQQNFIRTLSKSKDGIKDHELQRQILLTRLEQKQEIIQQLKKKLENLENEAISLRNAVKQKEQREKELTLRSNEIQKQKNKLDEQQKVISSLQQSCDCLNKDNTRILKINKDLQLQNAQLATIMDQFKAQIDQYKQKHTDLLLINQQLNNEIAHWQEKYEDGCLSLYQNSQADSQGDLPLASFAHSMKKSTLSMSNHGFGHMQTGNSRRLSSTSAQINHLRSRAQLETQYKKKIQQIIKDWKNKLYELVNKYEDQLQAVKEKTDKLLFQKQQLQRKVMALANEKCIIQTKLIQKQRQIYEMTKILSNTSINSQSKIKRQENQSNSIILKQQIKPPITNETVGSLKAQVFRST